MFAKTYFFPAECNTVLCLCFQISQNGISQQVAAIPVSAISSTQLSQVLNAAGTATGHIAIPLTPASAAAARKAVVAKSQSTTTAK